MNQWPKGQPEPSLAREPGERRSPHARLPPNSPLHRGPAPSREIPAPPVELVIAWAFAPMHKRVLGLALGINAALLVWLVTAFHVVARPPGARSIEALSQIFFGYEISWRGAFIGAWWAFVAGFVAGWFAAFLRNLVFATWLALVRLRANLAETRDFLDHI
jgi:hypothetical protein